MTIDSEDSSLAPVRQLFTAAEERAVAAAEDSSGLPSTTLAIYSRWWQLETWLRELAYVELRSRDGVEWEKALVVPAKRQQQDSTFTHMLGADNENPLAYLDYSQLISVIESNWDQFAYALVEKQSWDGRQVDLTRVRHRIGHMRKPHQDDLGRLEQTLRDLERGTFIALASYNRRWVPTPSEHSDAVSVGWLRGEHPTARRLLEHADRRYEIGLSLQISCRPWSSIPEQLSHAPGILWHADFYSRGERSIDVGSLWRENRLRAIRPLIVHLVSDSSHHVGVTFSGADQPAAISDAIGETFDAVLGASRRGTVSNADTSSEVFQRRVRAIDFRVLSGTGWNIVDDGTVPISSFGAGGGVTESPRW